MSTDLISFEYPTVCVTHVRGTECLPGVSYVCSFPRVQFPEGPQPVVQQ